MVDKGTYEFYIEKANPVHDYNQIGYHLLTVMKNWHQTFWFLFARILSSLWNS